MKTTAVAVVALAALAGAQEDNFDYLESLPTLEEVTVDSTTPKGNVVYDVKAAVAEVVADTHSEKVDGLISRAEGSTLRTRQTCRAEALGKGPRPADDTAAGFKNDEEFAKLAKGTTATAPAGYVQTFSNLQGSSQTSHYLGFHTLAQYDAGLCAAECNKVTACSAFNLYLERDPSEDPKCNPNAASTTTIKCVLWGTPLYQETAKNTGESRNGFEVVITASNGYNKDESTKFKTPAGYTAISGPMHASMNAPVDCNKVDTSMGSQTFTKGPFDPELCAAACAAKSAANLKSGSSRTCQFFNTYMQMKNNEPQGQICAMYTETWDVSYAKNVGGFRGTDNYTKDFSLFFSNTTDAGVPSCSV